MSPRGPDSDTTKAMHAMYRSGATCAAVAAAFGVSRQTVWKRFDRLMVDCRAKKRLPTIGAYGLTFTRKPTGYFRSTCAGRVHLHRLTWERERGPIPSGWDVHHIDGNKANNDIANLACMPKAEHTRLHARSA